MSFIEKIKKFFEKKKEKQEIKKISQDSILEFLEEEKKQSKKKLQKEVETFYESLFSYLDELENATNLLEEVNIHEKKEKERIKSIVESGKNDYVAALKKLIENLRKKKSPEEFFEHINKELVFFLKLEKRAKLKVTHLVGKEVENINNKLNNIKRLINKFLDDNGELLEKEKKINDLKKDFESLKEFNQKQKEIKNNIINIENQNKKINEKLKEIEININKIKQSEDFLKAKNLQLETEEKKKQLFKLEMAIKGFFDNKLFSKYIHFEPDNQRLSFIKNYVNEPVNSLKKDKNLEILGFLNDIKQKHGKKILLLKETDFKKLKEFIDSIPSLKQKIEKLEIDINESQKKNEVLSSSQKIDELEKEKKLNQEKINENISLIKKINSKFTSNENEKKIIKKDFSEKFKEICNSEIEWT